ncbi:hypothetical protein [uncultured Parolsenella sp.]|uniref:hypothetical protein n=1 Tax=uncultured Parolsenella sp. TaxID=2083008 RepID=UPI0025CF17E7|nr:hypothetical protein [uncultured Parolsenella sp.]
METSDKRREVAENLRYAADYSGYEIRYMEQFIAELRETVFCDVCSDADYSDILQRIADLIDPTTTVDETGVETVADAVHLCECNECGHSFEWVYGEYEYCPRCGARVVSGDE